MGYRIDPCGTRADAACPYCVTPLMILVDDDSVSGIDAYRAVAYCPSCGACGPNMNRTFDSRADAEKEAVSLFLREPRAMTSHIQRQCGS